MDTDKTFPHAKGAKAARKLSNLSQASWARWVFGQAILYRRDANSPEKNSGIKREGGAYIQRKSSQLASRFDYCRSEEHTSELQSQSNLVCRLLLEKKKTAMISCA